MISLLLSNKGRPEYLKKFLKSIEDSVSSMDNIEIIFGGNNGDLEANDVFVEWVNKNPIKYRMLLFNEPYFLNDKYNYLANEATGELIFGVANDLEFRTLGWDEEIIKEFEKAPKDKIYVLWINDGPGSEKLPRHYVIHKNYMLVTGGYSQKCLIHYFSDNWIYEVATGIGRGKYREDIVVQHHSPVLEKMEKHIVDDVMNEMNMFFVIDQHTWVNTSKYREYEIELLKVFIDNQKV